MFISLRSRLPTLTADYTEIWKEIKTGARVRKQVELRWHALIAEFVLVLLLAAVGVMYVGRKIYSNLL